MTFMETDFFGLNDPAPWTQTIHLTYLFRPIDWMSRLNILVSGGRSWTTLSEKKFRDYMIWKLNTGR